MVHKTIATEPDRNSSASEQCVLVADDSAPWRSQLRSFLQRETEWRIVVEACDGVEAVHKTLQLDPQVVFLDFRMPGLNGIEAARKIHQLAPHSKIIILTLEVDDDLMNAALEAGALACLRKTEITTDLIPAVEAALRTYNSSIS